MDSAQALLDQSLRRMFSLRSAPHTHTPSTTLLCVKGLDPKPLRPTLYLKALTKPLSLSPHTWMFMKSGGRTSTRPGSK